MATKKLETSKPKPTIDLIFEKNILTENGRWVFDETVDEFIVIGSKGSGKTFPVKVKEALRMNNDYYFHTFDGRKNHTAASKKLGGYIRNTLTLMAYRFDMGKPHRNQNNFYIKTRSKSDMDANPSQTYFAMNNLDATDGGMPANGGYIGILHIDEPVIEEDVSNPEKIASEKEWKFDMDRVYSNLNRSNLQFNNMRGTDHKTQSFFTMNPYGDHPLILKAERILPESEYIEYIFGFDIFKIEKDKEKIENLFSDEQWKQRIEDNCIMSRDYIDPETERKTKVVRNSAFANPLNLSILKKKALFADMKTALIDGDRSGLMLIIGNKAIPKPKPEMLVYPEEMKPLEKTVEEFVKEGWIIDHATFAWDIDTSRVLTFTPTYSLKKFIKKDEFDDDMFDWHVNIGEQVEIRANGTGKMGEKNDIYIEVIAQTMVEKYESLQALTQLPFEVAYVVDDKRKWYVLEISKKELPFITTVDTGKQHGKTFGIAPRQDTMINGFLTGKLSIHPNNKKILIDYKVCKKARIDEPERDTKGTTNYLDRIDSAEYSVQYYISVLLGDKYEWK